MGSRVEVVHIPIFFASWGSFFLIAFVSFYLQLKAGKQQISLSSLFNFLFPSEGWVKKSPKLDVFMYFMKKALDRFIPISFVFVTLAISSGIQFVLHRIFPGNIARDIGFLEIIICSIVVFLAVDLANYVTHAWEHYIPALWELHKVHHSATFLQPTTTARLHPIETIFDGLFASIFMAFPIGFFQFSYNLTMPECLILFANANLIGTIAVLDVLRHSQFPISFGRLDALLLSPHMHQAHHSVAVQYWDRNFGNKLSIWDWIFGTAIKPTPNEEFIYGLGTPEDKDFEKLSGLYFLPILKIWRLARARRFNIFMMRKGARFNRRRRKQATSRELGKKSSSDAPMLGES